MNIFLLAVLVAAAAPQAATPPFQWEFDFDQCGHLANRYQCFVTESGHLANMVNPHNHHNNYQKHPHVFAISPQSTKRWAVVMQTRSTNKTVDLTTGIKLNRIDKKNRTYAFIGCHVVNETVAMIESTTFEFELIDSYFDDHHLYCDFAVRPKQESGRNLLNYVRLSDRFELYLSLNGENLSFVENKPKPTRYIEDDDDEDELLKYIARFVYYFDDREKHDCDLSQVKYEPNKTITWQKIRQAEYFGNRFFCPDSRFALHVTSSKGKVKDNAKLECNNGTYEINDIAGTERKYGAFKLRKHETINVVCYVEKTHMCPLSIPCSKEKKCPYVIASQYTTKNHYRPPRYEIRCAAAGFDTDARVVVGESEHEFQEPYMVTCKEHQLVVSRSMVHPDKYESPPTIATVGYCDY